MKNTLIGACFGSIGCFLVLVYPLNELRVENEELKLQIDGYKLLVQQQELLLEEEQQVKSRYINTLNQVLYMCVEGELIPIRDREYKCYHMYSM